jgi:hypothetical protein
MPRLISRAINAIGVLVLLAPLAAAQETRQEFWPEFQAFWKLNSTLRVRLVAQVTRARETEKHTEGIFEADLDIGVKAFFRTKLFNVPDAQRGKYLTLRTGYAYIPSFGEEDPPKEHRIVLEATGRYLLPLDILVSDRSRGDLRWINREFSTRYRNRLRIERDFSIGKFRFTPYAQGELFYDFRVDIWNRNEISAGAEIPVGSRFVIEPYYLRQHNIRSQTEHVNGVGLVFQWHF